MSSSAAPRVANVLAAVQANMVNRGLVPEVDSSSLLQKLMTAVHDLRVACRVSYAFKINEEKMHGWKTASLASMLKSVHVTPEVQDKFAAVYGEAIDQMRKILEETYDRTVAEMTHRIDTFEKELTAQASDAQASMAEQLEHKYIANRLELEAIVAEMKKENEHQRSNIVFLERRLRELEKAPDRGDVELCNKLRARVNELETSMEILQTKCTEVESQHANAKKLVFRLESDISLLRAKYEMTKGMYARETSQLCDIIRMNEAQFMQVQHAEKLMSPTKRPQTSKPTSPRRTVFHEPQGVECYDPNSGRKIVFVEGDNLAKAPAGVQFAAHSATSPPKSAQMSRRETRHAPNITFQKTNNLPTPKGSIARPYI